MFYGIKGIKFIYHGDWTDPEVEYKGRRFNYYMLEDTLYNDYNDSDDKEKEIPFEDWVKKHDYLAYEILDNYMEFEDKNGGNL